MSIVHPHSMTAFEDALDMWRKGKREQAQSLCEALVAVDGGAADTWSLLAEIYALTDQSNKAIVCLERLTNLRPEDAVARRRLGDALLGARANASAAEAYRQALTLDPKSARCQNNLGVALMRLGDIDEALHNLQLLVAAQPQYAAARENLRMALESRARHGDSAAQRAQREVEVRGLVERGLEQLRSGDAAQAWRSFNDALQRAPDQLGALIGGTCALLRQGFARDALQLALHAMRVHGDVAEAQANGAAVYLALRLPAAALECCDRALLLDSQSFEALFNRAEAFRALHRQEQAVEAFERALAVRPQFAATLCGLGHTYRDLGDAARAGDCYRRAVKSAPDDPAARFGLVFSTIPVLPGDGSEIDRSRQELAGELASLETWLDADASHEVLLAPRLNALFSLAYQERPNRDLLVRYGTLAARALESWRMQRGPPAQRFPGPRDERLRLGIVTAHAREHSVYRALLHGWLARIDRERIHVTLLSLASTEDAVTSQVRLQTAFINCAGMTLGEAVEAIRSRDVDVLLYPEIGLDPLVMQLASLRLAGCQIASWGHPETTGLPTIDYFLSAEAFEPPGAQRHYSEKLALLPGLGCYYLPSETQPSVDLAALGLSPEVPILLSAGTPYKYSAEHDGVLVEIVRQLGECQIVFFEAEPRALNRRLLDRIRRRFDSAGIDPAGHLVSIPWLSRSTFFGLMRSADVYLDTLGFSGFNTTMQAVECELPIVAYEGQFMRGRFASAILRQLGLDEFICGTEADYVHQAVKLAQDAECNARVRAKLAGERARLYRNDAVVDELTRFLTSLPRGRT